MKISLPGSLKRSVVVRIGSFVLALALLVTALPVQPQSLSQPAHQNDHQVNWITPDWVNWNS